jgi:uncharacterized membrane protein
MIIQIAAGVCIGIVLAVVILKYWREMVGGTVVLSILLSCLLVLAAILAGILIVSKNPEVRWGAVFLTCMIGVPGALLGYANRRLPALAHRRPPWDRGPRALVPFLVMLGAVIVGFGALVLLIAALERFGVAVH